jgi:GDP-L-fucose synthase
MLWGSGTPRREFIHSDDVADASILLLESDTSTLPLPINLGIGKDFSIAELAEIIASIIGYKGSIEWDRSQPNGAPRKLLDSGRLRAFGWKPKIEFEEGIKNTYQWYLDNVLCKETRL